MKLTPVIVFLFVLANRSSAQIVTSPAVDVSTLITNIFGIQCQGVSNVSVTGLQSQIARFENGGYLGVNSGLVMSTGLTENLGDANTSSSSGFDTGAPGSAEISNYGGMTSYNAIAIDFDFFPGVTDTIRFNYIFASEEYPEFSNTQFTDRFLFLVSENGGAVTNVALVPGTTNTPVEINTINQDVNNQFYIDNQTGANAAIFMFDGYTVPLQAKFFAQTGNSYHIKLVIADVGDGAFDSAIFLDEQESYNDINGNLTVGGLPAEGTIDVFNYIEDTLVATPVETVTVTNGTYLIDSLPTGMYHVRFTPDPVLFPGAAPLYFATSSTWTGADAIGLPCYLSDANIDADTLDVNGSGSVSGNIVIDTSYLKSLTVPFEGALLLLKSTATNETKGFAFSDMNGNYTISNVPAGDYYLLADVPYIPHSDTLLFNVPNGGDVLGADYEILTEGITSNGTPYLGTFENKEIGWSMSPNPATQFVTITSEKVLQTIKVFGINGTLLMEYPTNGVETTLDIHGFTQGVYLIQLDDTTPKRLIISK